MTIACSGFLGLLIASVGNVAELGAQPSQGGQVVRVQWITRGLAATARTGAGANPLRLLERRAAPGSVPRQRRPQLSAGQLLVQAVDDAGVVIHSHLIADPRTVRAESPGPTGELTGEVLRREDPDFLITLPALPPRTSVQLYQPRWTGNSFVLEFIGNVPLE